jgi:FMN phosphatase YigB (HAD superfamily)
MVPHAYEDSVAIMDGLIDDGRDVTMLTNFAADTFVEARERFPFLNRPRGVTVSGEVRLLKPDRAIYELHAESFGLDPAATLFIDDSRRMSTAPAMPAGRRCIFRARPAWRPICGSSAFSADGPLVHAEMMEPPMHGAAE